MATVNVVVASGFAVSSAFVIEPAARSCAFQVASAAASIWFVEFSQTSGTAPWARFKRPDTGLDYVVCPGGGDMVGGIPWCPSPFARLAAGANVAT